MLGRSLHAMKHSTLTLYAYRKLVSKGSSSSLLGPEKKRKPSEKTDSSPKYSQPNDKTPNDHNVQSEISALTPADKKRNL